MAKSYSKKKDEILKQEIQPNVELHFNLHRFGDHIAEREGYKVHTGMDAIHYYLVQKHHWLPGQVKSLNFDDLQFLFAEEMKGWTVPKGTL